MLAWWRHVPGSAPEVAPRPDAAARDDDSGVSPVIGMILVLGISIVAIAAILYWGLPAIDEMKANVEFRSVQTQFTELDGTIKELVAGTTEKTAKRWEPTLNRGSVSVSNNTEGWIYATDLYVPAHTTTDFIWDGMADGDNTFGIYNNLGSALVGGTQVKGYIVTGSSTQTALHVSTASDGSQMVAATLPTWNAGAWQKFYVADVNNVGYNLQGQTFLFQVFDASGNKLAEAYFMNTGRIDYALHAGLGDKTVTENNGAVMTGGSAPGAIVNTPSIPPPSTTGNVPRFFARAVVLYGNASYAGDNRFSALISLYSTAVLANYDCALADHSDCAVTSKVTNYGTAKSTWNAYLQNTGLGYHFTPGTVPANGGGYTQSTGATYLKDTRTYMGYTLLQSTILMSG